MHDNLKEGMKRLSFWKKNRRDKIAPLLKNIAYKPTFHADTYREAAFRRFIELYTASQSNAVVYAAES